MRLRIHEVLHYNIVHAEFEIDGNHMLWSSEEGHLFHSKGISPVPDLNNIHIFAYDWIGNTLYWAPTKPQKNMVSLINRVV